PSSANTPRNASKTKAISGFSGFLDALSSKSKGPLIGHLVFATPGTACFLGKPGTAQLKS
ncbi:MAG: hypothetical protein ACK53L_22370, partial [Pirellulaceae bacterium]